ncbi:MAG: DUF1572 family protein [Candidatus Hodarchaeales archaeon]|jgi:hypothetical protein
MNNILKDNEINDLFLKTCINRFQQLKDISEKAVTQVKKDEKLFWLPDGESNSIAIIMKHLSGNMKSRWTNVFTEDGEKKDRNRPNEFDREFKPNRKELLKIWDQGWNILFTTLYSLNPKDLMKKIFIRKESHTVLDAILRQLTHYSLHVGQILFLAKHIEWENWTHLTLPRDAEVFNYEEIKKYRLFEDDYKK